MKKILILGIDGMLGNALARYLEMKDDFIICKTTRKEKVNSNNSAEYFFNVENNFTGKILAIINATKPSVIINCIGFIRPDDTREDLDKSILINAFFPQILSQVCFDNKIRLIHFSTDCIFNGRKGEYTELDFPNEKAIYGVSKYLGETKQVPNLTIRTSIIGKEISNQRNLLDWFLATKNSKVKGYRNVFWNGITTITMARIVERIISQDIIFNKPLIQIASNRVSKFELLGYFQEIFKKDIIIEPDDEVISDKTLIPSVEQDMFFNDLVPAIKDQIVELKKLYSIL